MQGAGPSSAEPDVRALACAIAVHEPIAPGLFMRLPSEVEDVGIWNVVDKALLTKD